MKIHLSTLFFIVSYVGYGQCDCSELLKYGLYNHYSNTQKVENLAIISESVSDMNSQTISTNRNDGFKLGKLGGNFSRSQASSMNKLFTSDNLSVTDGAEFIQQNGAVISSEMVSAYKTCLQLCTESGLKIKADIGTDNISKAISFTVTFRGIPNSTTIPMVKGITVTPKDCYRCSGTLQKLSDSLGSLQRDVTYALTCERTIAKQKFIREGTESDYILAESAKIMIETTMGVYSVRIPPIYTQPEFKAGIGEIKISMLEPNDFIRLYGSDWKLADGSAVPNTVYSREIAPNIPDLRGVFLRGKNYDRPNNGNPDGDSDLGTLQQDAIQDHSHSQMVGHDMEGGGGSGSLGRGQNQRSLKTYTDLIEKEYNLYYDGNRARPIVKTHPKETRPINVTVNYYIKVN